VGEYPDESARRCEMKDELAEKFPKLTLQACQLPSGEWIVASLTKPLTEGEAEKAIAGYQTIQELIARVRALN
jgi:hypothetical protein